MVHSVGREGIDGRGCGWWNGVEGLLVVDCQDLLADRPVLLLAEIVAHECHVPLLRVLAPGGHLDAVDLQREGQAAHGNVGRLKGHNVWAVMEILHESSGCLGDRHRSPHRAEPVGEKLHVMQ